MRKACAAYRLPRDRALPDGIEKDFRQCAPRADRDKGQVDRLETNLPTIGRRLCDMTFSQGDSAGYIAAVPALPPEAPVIKPGRIPNPSRAFSLPALDLHLISVSAWRRASAPRVAVNHDTLHKIMRLRQSSCNVRIALYKHWQCTMMFSRATVPPVSHGAEREVRRSPNLLKNLAPRPGLEPGTCGLTVRRSTS